MCLHGLRGGNTFNYVFDVKLRNKRRGSIDVKTYYASKQIIAILFEHSVQSASIPRRADSYGARPRSKYRLLLCSHSKRVPFDGGSEHRSIYT